MIILTETQQQALSEDKTNPPIVLNPATNEKFVLIPAGEYDKMRALLAEENARFTQEMAPLLDEVMERDRVDSANDQA